MPSCPGGQTPCLTDPPTASKLYLLSHLPHPVYKALPYAFDILILNITVVGWNKADTITLLYRWGHGEVLWLAYNHSICLLGLMSPKEMNENISE